MALIMDTTLNEAIEIIEGKLYMGFHAEDSQPNKNASNYVTFTNDCSLVFTSFFADFGPLDLGHTHKFCTQLQDTMSRAKEKNKPVLYCCSNHPHHRSNGAVMICAYMIFVHNCTAERAYGPFMGINPPFITFRDAGFCINTFPITVLDCARAMRRACTLNHFNFKAFNVMHFQALAKLQNGDLSWIVPGKFLAFSGPLTKRRQLSPGVYSLTPEGYVPVLKKLDVSCIVRFNSKCYDRNVFLVNGIRHVDLYYEDGGNPSEEILQAFLQLCETERGAVAVHCKAGLGRTGTNIAAYMMKHYSYTARETMAWCRLCRPGSIVGPQQQYLASIEARMFREGAEYRLKHRLPAPAGDERSLASASGGSLDGVLSTYTGISVSGAASVGGLSTSLGTSAGTGQGHHHTGSNDTQRVMTPPLIGCRVKQQPAAESLFRNAVSANKPKDSSTDSSGYHTPGTGSVTGGTPRGSGGGGERGLATQSTSLKGAYPYAQQQQGGGQGGAYANANDTEMRRPATSGGILSKSTNSSPLRGQAEVHSTSFTYGAGAGAIAAHSPQNQNINYGANQANQSNQQAAMYAAAQSPTAGSQGYAYRSSHSGAHVIDHDAGPGKLSAESENYGNNNRSGYRPITPQSPNPNGVGSPNAGSSLNSTANGARRSVSTSRYAAVGSPSNLAAGVYHGQNGAGGANKVEFYDGGRNVSQAGNGALSSPERDGNRLRLSTNLSPQETGSRPGTSGGVRYGTNTNGAGRTDSGGYNTQQVSSPYNSKPSGLQSSYGTGNGNSTGNSTSNGLRLQDYAYESNGAGGAYVNNNTLTVSRPRTSGGVLSSSGGQGRSASSGRAGSTKRRF